MDNQQQGCYKITPCGVEVKQIDFAKDYYVSKCGKVFHYCNEELIRKKGYYKDGYVEVCLKVGKGKYKKRMIHRLVALTYLDNPDLKPQVNHIDGNKENNNLENLEWVSPKENIRHAIKTGLIDCRGERSSVSVLREEDVIYIYNQCLNGHSRADLARKFNIAETTIWNIITRQAWKHLTGNLPKIVVRDKANNLSEGEVRIICQMLQNGDDSKLIYDKIGRDKLTKSILGHIRHRRTYKNISKDYHW